MIRVFIDESGNLGRGGQYFVLAAAVFDTPQGIKRAARLIRKTQIMLAKDKLIPIIEEIKSCRLSVPQRQRILNKLVAKADIDIFYLVVDKEKSNFCARASLKTSSIIISLNSSLTRFLVVTMTILLSRSTSARLRSSP